MIKLIFLCPIPIALIYGALKLTRDNKVIKLLEKKEWWVLRENGYLIILWGGRFGGALVLVFSRH